MEPLEPPLDPPLSKTLYIHIKTRLTSHYHRLSPTMKRGNARFILIDHVRTSPKK